MKTKEFELSIVTELSIPPFMMSDVLSKLAYVDELIASASILPDGTQILLKLREEPDQNKCSELANKVHTVVDLMVKNARPPRIQVLEDFLDSPVPYSDDPMSILEQSGEVLQEATGLLLLGPLMSRLIDFFENTFLSLATDFEAKPFRFPTLIPAKYLDRVNYFKSFPHYLTFATHLREDLPPI